MSITYSPEFLRKRKFFMIVPLIAVPGLVFIFYSLKGGTGVAANEKVVGAGFNTELPAARLDKFKADKNKLDLYKQADQDSQRRKEWLRQDPYIRRVVDSLKPHAVTMEDVKADELLQRLDKLKESLRQPVVSPVVPAPVPVYTRRRAVPVSHVVDSNDDDPQLEKLNGMLDKIIRIQHPVEGEGAVSAATMVGSGVDTAAANSLPAVVEEDQVLTAGASIALRLTEGATINGLGLPKDQLVYGVVSLSNDRMLINVNSIRREQSIYSMALQVYDLDGLPGIHIPGSLGRETAKQSVDQSINSLGVGGLEATPAAQVTNAGILTARSFFSRKVRMVRVTVRAGYQVLLRSTKMPVKIRVDRGHVAADSIGVAPDAAEFTPFMHRVVHREKMKLRLEGIYLRDSLLWVMLGLENHSPIGYVPAYVRWCVRDRKQSRRTAVQDIVLKPVYSPPVDAVLGDSSRIMLTGFRPFALPRDKELVLQLAESNGARELVLEIGEKELLKIQRYEKQEGQTAAKP